MTVFAMPIFDATVVFEGQEMFKGRGSATSWAEKLAKEIGGSVDGEPCKWGIHGQRLKRLD
jgi:hypothetical protein